MTQTPVLIAVVPLIPILIAIIIVACLGAALIAYNKSLGAVGEILNGPVGYALAAVVLVLSVLATWKAARGRSTGKSAASPKPIDRDAAGRP